MKTKCRLRDIAHARAGDKGNHSNISLWFNERRHFDAASNQITEQLLKDNFPSLILGSVTIYPLPGLLGLNIVLENALEGGVNGSLNLDGHGKSWSFLILDLEIEVELD